MAAKVQEVLLRALPELLRERAVDLTDDGVFEYAFPVSDRQEVFEHLFNSAFIILGGDLWESVEDGFRPCGDNWAVNLDNGEDVAEKWAKFVASFPVHAGHYVTFVVRAPR
jgi:hypothetical protein